MGSFLSTIGYSLKSTLLHIYTVGFVLVQVKNH